MTCVTSELMTQSCEPTHTQCAVSTTETFQKSVILFNSYVASTMDWVYVFPIHERLRHYIIEEKMM